MKMVINVLLGGLNGGTFGYLYLANEYGLAEWVFGCWCIVACSIAITVLTDIAMVE